MDLVEKMLKTTGRRVDMSSPFVDAMLPDGSRLHVVIPDITRKHWSVNIRNPWGASRTVVPKREVSGIVTRSAALPAKVPETLSSSA